MVPQKVVPANLTTNEKQLERWKYLSRSGRLKSASGCRGLLFPLMFNFCSVVCCPNCLPSGHLFFRSRVLRVKLFINQVIHDIYKYDYDNKLFISLGEVDHDMAEDLRSWIHDWDQRWLKVADPSWSGRVSTESPFLCIERGTGQHFYKVIDSDDKPYIWYGT